MKNDTTLATQYLYAITADYRPKNPNKPIYYVFAQNRKQARQKFTNTITWLKIYDIQELSEEEAYKIVSEGKYKHIILQ